LLVRKISEKKKDSMLPAIATKKNFREEKGFVKCFWWPACLLEEELRI
jgi:nitrogenase molybdenum-iron protein alpha/beta subunit